MRQLLINLSIGVLLSLICIVLILRGMDFSQIGETLSQVDFSLCVWYFVALFGIHMIRLVRWGLLLQQLGEIHWSRVWAICAVGQLAIYLFPARLGEVVRPLLVGEESTITFGETSATVAVERIVDGLIVSSILFITILLMGIGNVPSWFVYSGFAAAGLFLGLLLAIIIAALMRETTHKLIKSIFGRISENLADKLSGLVDQFFKGWSLLRQDRLKAVLYVVSSIIMWLLMAFTFPILFRAFGYDELGIVAGLALLSLLIVGIMIPSAPGFTGTFHSATILALGLFAIPHESAVDFAVLLHFETVGVNLVLGTGGLLLGKISFTRVFRLSREKVL